MEYKWFHAIGICGKATSNVAMMFKKKGWYVTGSDSQFFPPVSTFLNDEKIPTVEGYNYTHLTKEFWIENVKSEEDKKVLTDPDFPKYPTLCLIVETSTDKNKEYLFAKKNSIPVKPFAEILKEYLIKPESIVVVGTAGKTTTTALITNILIDLGINPSYMIGAEVLNLKDSLKDTDSKYSVMEGDEYYSPVLSKGAKFFSYLPKYLIITKLNWDHQDIYKTEEEYMGAFQRLVETIPVDGLIVAKKEDINIDNIVKHARCKVIRYSFQSDKLIANKEGNSTKSDYWRSVRNSDNSVSLFDNLNIEKLRFNNSLIGEYNVENITASLCLLFNILEISSIDNFKERVINTINNFKGAKKRLEFLYKSDSLIVIDDFGVTPSRASNSLNTIKKQFPDFKITAVFEPNAGSRIKDINIFNDLYKDSFRLADEVIIPNLSANPDLINQDEIVNQLNDLGFNAKHIQSDKILDELKLKLNKDQEKVVFLFLSSYRLTSIGEEFSKLARS